jgi:predicted PurR-regulated permease PerM
MNRGIDWLQKLGLRQMITVFLVAITFLVVPAFGYSQSLQAQADTLIAKGDSYIVDDATVKRIQDKAEDLGDSPERPIGDTGLKNIRKLGENIPETIKFNAEQKLGIDDPKDVLNGAQNQIKKAVEGTKRAVKDAAS